jgi:HOMODA hydrolase
VQVSIWNDLLGAEVRCVRTPEFGVTRIIEAGRQNDEALLLWTRHNPIHDVAAAQAALPRGSLYVMHGQAAHWPQYEQPDEFNTVMHAFLSTGKT